jgi:DNA polymerase III subunit epsilon
MNPLRHAVEYLLGGPKVGGAQEARLGVWRDLPEPDLRVPHAQMRYVVVDTETTGLDLRRDRVIAIGAAAVDRGRLRLSDCFETVLRQDKASADANILIHGIGGQMQLHGVDPRAGMLDFLEYIGRMPLVAFRAEFDATMLERALKAIVGFPLRRTWIDLAFLLPALFPGTECRTLDDWLDHFGLGGDERHHAVADAFASAQLLQIALAAAQRHEMGNAAALVAMQKAQRWLGKR